MNRTLEIKVDERKHVITLTKGDDSITFGFEDLNIKTNGLNWNAPSTYNVSLEFDAKSVECI